MDSFDLKQFLIENKLTGNFLLNEIQTQPGNTGLSNLNRPVDIVLPE